MARSKDSLDLAKLRWFTNEIDNLSIGIFATDDKYEELVRVLKQTIRQLSELSREIDENICPWDWCEDWSCRPMCPVYPAQPSRRDKDSPDSFAPGP